MQMKSNNQGKVTSLSIAAFTLSLLGCTSFIGVILGIIDVSKKDGRSRGLSIAAITVGILITGLIITTLICAFAFGAKYSHKEEEIIEPMYRFEYEIPNAPSYGPERTPSPEDKTL